MAGPWEEYSPKSPTHGPWEEYGAIAPSAKSTSAFRPTGPLPGEDGYTAPERIQKPSFSEHPIDYIMSQGGTFDPRTGGRKLLGDVEAALSGGAGLSPIPNAGMLAKESIKAAGKVPTAAQELIKEGVKLTPAQMAGSGGLGTIARSLENKARSIPLTGEAITAAQKRAVETWNMATANKVLEPLGITISPKAKAGTDLVGMTSKSVSDAYKAIHKDLKFTADADFGKAVKDVVSSHSPYLSADDARRLEGILKTEVLGRLARTKSVPEVRGVYGEIVRPATETMVPNTLSGSQLQTLRSQLRSEARSLSRSSSAGDRRVGQAIEDVNFALGDALSRTNPQAAAELQKADTAYAMLTRMEEAAANRVSSGGVFTPNDLLAASKRLEGGPRNKAFARGDALLQNWGKRAQEVITSYPDSGTAGRSALMEGLLGGGAGAEAVRGNIAPLAGMAAGAVPYLPPSIDAMNYLATTGRIMPNLSEMSTFVPGMVGAATTRPKE